MYGLQMHPALHTNNISTLKPETLIKKAKADQKTTEERAAAKAARKEVSTVYPDCFVIFEDAKQPQNLASFGDVVNQLTIFRDWENINYMSLLLEISY